MRDLQEGENANAWVFSMRFIFLALLSLAFPIVTPGQSTPTQAFREWARAHAHPVPAVDQDSHDAELQSLKDIVGNAQVVEFGEPIHGGYEPLEMRNPLIRYGVKHLGFTAVALETCLSPSKSLYDYVLGRSDESDSVLDGAFCYGFGNLPENLELVHWLHTYNTAQPPGRQVRIYGIDLTAQYMPYAPRSIEAVLAYLDRVDPRQGSDIRKQYSDLLPVLRSDKYVKLAPAEKDVITARVQDLIARIERERIQMTDATSPDDYEWALRQALTASQDDANLRCFPPEWDPDLMPRSPEKFRPDERWDQNAEMRELAMADNLLWVLQRECHRGKVLLFAHDLHVQTGVQVVGAPGKPVVGPWRRVQSTGGYLRSALGTDVVVIGTYYGSGVGFPHLNAPRAETHEVEDILASLETRSSSLIFVNSRKPGLLLHGSERLMRPARAHKQ
jgi:erythromycin esterase